MKTLSYKITRIIIQIFGIVSLLLNIFTFIVFFSSSLDKIEQNLQPKPFVLFSDMSVYIALFNMFFALISLCSITSKSKLFMTVCGNFLCVQLFLNIITTVYFGIFYKNSILSSFAHGMINNKSGFVILARSANIIPENGNTLEGLKSYINRFVNIFSVSQIITSVLGYSMVKMFSYVVSVPLEKKIETPEIKKASKIGNIDLKLNKMQSIPIRGC